MSRGSAAPWKKRARPGRSTASWQRSCRRCRSVSTRWPRRRAGARPSPFSGRPTPAGRRRRRAAAGASRRCSSRSRGRPARATWRAPAPRWSACAPRRTPRSTTLRRRGKAAGMVNAIPVLVVDDDAVSSAQLGALAKAAGYDVKSAFNGREAWELLQVARIPIVISDWYMPEMDGPELCRRIRARTGEPYVYFILVTARGGKQQYLAGMEAGADDFIAKPVDPDELRARLTVAERILGLRKELAQLEVLLPICSYCKRIRNDKEEWEPLERYIETHFERLVTHSLFPDCYVKHVQPQLDQQEGSA